MTNTKIDTTKRLELEDGTPVTFERRSYVFSGFPLRAIFPSGENRHFSETGVPYSAGVKRLRNVAEVNPFGLFNGKKLQTRSGTPAEFVTVHNGKAIFKLSYPSPGWGSRTTGFVERNLDGTVSGSTTSYGTTRSDPDDIIVVPERVTTFRNVYADGTVGDTAHKTITAVMSAIKSGKVRVGILKQIHEGAELVDAKMVARTPERRDGSKAFPKA